MTTIHVIANAHLDPVWLWRWPAGVVAALSTCRSVVTLLEEYPELIFTRSDVWFYEQVERYEPELIPRIRTLIERGQWSVVGGMYIQPDCNLPLGASFERHLTLGRAYFKEMFGVAVSVGFNPDSFGHAGSLPRILPPYGIDSYVMMRPMQHEMHLPGPLFRWRTQAGDDGELLTWRVPLRYNSSTIEQFIENVHAVLEGPTVGGVHDVMCFMGVGDHGGGPTREQVEWVLANPHYFDGCELCFSDPRRFFDAVRDARDSLPIVAGELQYHAVGCYSVVREGKVHLRRAEYELDLAERALTAAHDVFGADDHVRLAEAWKQVLFNQFHDTLGGTCLPEAHADGLDQVRHAAHIATEVIWRAAVAYAGGLPPSPLQRLVAVNYSPVPYHGYVECDPWLDWLPFRGDLIDERGESLEYQPIPGIGTTGESRTILVPISVSPGEAVVMRMNHGQQPFVSDAQTRSWGAERAIGNRHLRVEPSTSQALFCCESTVDGLRFDVGVQVIADPSDTWSHGVDGYAWDHDECFAVDCWDVSEAGPLRAAARVAASVRSSRIESRVRLYRDSDVVELRLRLTWSERLHVAKLALRLPELVQHRRDSIPGGVIERRQDRREYPMTGYTEAALESGTRFGIVAPDVFALDGGEATLRFTLCRSPAYAWQGHKCLVDEADGVQWTDQGDHEFRFLFVPSPHEGELEQRLLNLVQPPVVLDWTRGMGST